MRRRKYRRSAEIDITPLIDVLFMLIIFFVLTASFVQGKLDIDLPSADGNSSGIGKAVTVTVERDGGLFWDGTRVDKRGLRSLAENAKGRSVLVAGDRSVSYGTIAEVLSILRKGGVTSAGLLMQGENSDR
jgi:biopolymer transport protein ExbD